MVRALTNGERGGLCDLVDSLNYAASVGCKDCIMIIPTSIVTVMIQDLTHGSFIHVVQGKVGEITEIFKHDNSVIVKDLNLKTKHVKSREEGEPGQIIKLSSQGPTHDEIHFEFLRNLSGDPYILRTNIFTQGKGNREQQFYLWFNPTRNFHTYSIISKPQHIIEYLVATVNGFGIVVETIYVILFLIYAPKGIRGRTAILAVILDVAISAEAVATTQLALQGEARGGAVGVMGAGLNIVIYFSPLCHGKLH
ncbi:hypothetical protein JHK82_052779 [Glycine max]|nr:hypothetical protein JHK86_052627 [Glycine max]KAG4926994.1 hypothetical protein JHK85_053480 [Glycine max]KAG5082621.1 hypothetical protein JHK84_052659 [Glycine max]KAG5085382.1 hypothetical protein JHK82_052779 [Glycine max]